MTTPGLVINAIHLCVMIFIAAAIVAGVTFVIAGEQGSGLAFWSTYGGLTGLLIFWIYAAAPLQALIDHIRARRSRRR